MFLSREFAGDQLADRILELGWKIDLVLGVPRGGIVVADRVARKLRVPLNVVLAKKIGAPRQPEFAVGAVSEGGQYTVDTYWSSRVGLDEHQLHRQIQRLSAEIDQSLTRYREIVPAPIVVDQNALVVDDGAATGSTLVAVCETLRARQVAEVYVGVPVSSDSAALLLERAANGFFSCLTPDHFRAVGEWYETFDQVTSDQAEECLRNSTHKR